MMTRGTWPPSTGTTPEPGMEMLTVPEAARRYRMGPVRMRALIDSGAIPVIRLGRRILIRPQAVEEYLLSLEARRGT